MTRRLLIGLAVGAGIVCSLAPPALAGTFTWQLPTSQAPGPSNPDHDTYGASPWSYVEAASGAPAGPPPIMPSSFAPLGTYSNGIDGGLTGWQDLNDASQPFVAVNRAATPISGGQGLQVPPGQLALQPASDRVVGIGWTSPLSSFQTITVSGTFQADAPTSNCPGSQPTWALEQGGMVVASQPPPATPGQVGTPQQFTTSVTMAPGDTVYLVIGWYGVPAGYSSSCTTAGLSLTIQAPASPPNVSISNPSPGETITGRQPTFSGGAGRGFGVDHAVTVRVWSGSAVGGKPVETLTADASGGRYSAPAQPPLRNGTYTAQAEQDDQAGDAAVSEPVTFKVHNVVPKVTRRVIAGPPTLTRSSHAEISIMCTAASGVCAGDVLVLTHRVMRPRPDGPSGHVRVLFAYLRLAAGHSMIVRRAVADYVAAALRRAAPVAVDVTVSLKDSSGRAIAASAAAVLRLGR